MLLRLLAKKVERDAIETLAVIVELGLWHLFPDLAEAVPEEYRERLGIKS